MTPTSVVVRVPEAVSAGPLQLTGEFLGLALVFFVLAVVAAAVGMRGLAGVSMEVARILVLVFLVLAVVSLLL